jgi:phosphohistidine phosphatase SixA
MSEMPELSRDQRPLSVGQSAGVFRRRWLLLAALPVTTVQVCAEATAGPAGTAGASGATVAASAATWPALRDGDIVLFRHALAPGVGDPAGFVLGDCRTQRLLSAEGVQQARQIGAAWRGHRPALRVGRLLSSQWCRTLDTAREAFPQSRLELEPAFNSFFQEGSAAATRQTQAALALLQAWQGPGLMVVVSHQVNIQALSGQTLASGEGLAVRIVGGRLQVLGRVPAPPV